MTDQQNRPQSLLEAAKTLASHLSLVVAWPKDRDYQNLLAAISREEERPPATTDGERRCWEGLVDSWRKGHDEQRDRAQQAEANEQWLRNECNRIDRLVADERQRAEKAEAELASKESVTVQQVAFEVAALRRDVDELRRFLPRLGGKS